jgi:hypothetical protein
VTKHFTLPLRLSMVLASTRTQDGRDIDAARREMLQMCRDTKADTVEVFACKRHGGGLVHVYESPNAEPYYG